MPRQKKPLAPKPLLQELLLRQDELIKQHSREFTRVRIPYNQPKSQTT